MKKTKKENLPFHVAVIPDGNRRWAKRRDLDPWKGHEEGAKTVEALSQKALDTGIKCITFWGSSKDNLTKRPLKEKIALLDIYERYFKKLVKDAKVYENEVKIRIVGHWKNQFPPSLKKILEDGIEKTKNHNNNFINFLLAYDGSDDMMEAVRRIVTEAREKVNSQFKITQDLISKNLLSSEIPPVDLIIRTGVENDPHNSAGFLMWQTRNSQYYFSEKLFPNFGPSEFEKAIEDYQRRDRRLGK